MAHALLRAAPALVPTQAGANAAELPLIEELHLQSVAHALLRAAPALVPTQAGANAAPTPEASQAPEGSIASSRR